MKKRIFKVILILLIIINSNLKIPFAENEEREFSIFLDDAKNSYMSLVKEELERLAKEDSEEIKLNFYDANNDLNIQRNQLEVALEEGTDIILISLVDPATSWDFINRVKEENIPIEIFERELLPLEAIQSYEKGIFIGSDLGNLANLQGEIIKNGIGKGRIKDRNNNGYIDFIMVNENLNKNESTIKTEEVIDYLTRVNIKTQILEKEAVIFNGEDLREIMERILIKYLDDVDLIILNNDSMSTEVIESLQEVGYNKGDSDRYIPVVGIGGDREAIELINKGFMEGTVLKGEKDLAEALLNIGLNLQKGRDPLENTHYEFKDSRIIRLKDSKIILRK